MAIREGRCPNCGSIINIDLEKNNRCIFCWAEVDPEKAISLAEDVGDYVFPNDIITEPDDSAKEQALSAYRSGVSHTGKSRRTTSSKPVTKKVVDKKISAAEQVAKLNQDFAMPDVKVDKRSLTITLAIICSIIVAIVAVTIPVVKRRDANKAEISMRINKVIDWTNDETLAFHGLKNDKLIVVNDSNAGVDSAENMMKEYTKAYLEVTNIDSKDLNLELFFYSKSGLSYFKNVGGEIKLQNK